MDNVEVAKLVFAFIAVCGIALLFVVGGVILPIKLTVSYIRDGELIPAFICALSMVVVLSVVALFVMEAI